MVNVTSSNDAVNKVIICVVFAMPLIIVIYAIKRVCECIYNCIASIVD